MSKSEEDFKGALAGKKLPILTLDNKWHRLFTQHNQDKETKKLVEKLNELVARQGGLNHEIKDIKKLKAKLMNEIVSGVDEKPLTDKQMEEHKRLIAECNEKIDGCQDELLDLPKEIDPYRGMDQSDPRRSEKECDQKTGKRIYESGTVFLYA